ncbi:EIF3M isoform 11 [Pan troglodytes]|uniref:Eukaryotic translation initiation factor 3 subunit M n=2 Tax=Homininae TaxID=207598 RepID=E9PSB3_HUMAN|nr:EIF3M isoform 11 [Pan troglodytes]
MSVPAFIDISEEDQELRFQKRTRKVDFMLI